MTPERAGRGHGVLPHTADVMIEAWAPTAAGCYEEAVGAMVDAFADVEGAVRTATVHFEVGPGSPAELLVLLLEEVLAVLDIRGLVPVATRVALAGDRLQGSFAVVPPGAVTITGSVPKGIAYHALVFEARDAGYWCRATVDV